MSHSVDWVFNCLITNGGAAKVNLLVQTTEYFSCCKCREKSFVLHSNEVHTDCDVVRACVCLC